jgi:hypothetical protein
MLGIFMTTLPKLDISTWQMLERSWIVYFSLGCAYKAIHFTWKLTAYSYIVSLIFLLLGSGRMAAVVGSFFKPAKYFPTSGCCLGMFHCASTSMIPILQCKWSVKIPLQLHWYGLSSADIIVWAKPSRKLDITSISWQHWVKLEFCSSWRWWWDRYHSWETSCLKSTLSFTSSMTASVC